jgi:hypothetical protein
MTQTEIADRCFAPPWRKMVIRLVAVGHQLRGVRDELARLRTLNKGYPRRARSSYVVELKTARPATVPPRKPW